MSVHPALTPEQIQEREARQNKKSLILAHKILGPVYLVLPFLLVFLLFIVFPPSQKIWGDWTHRPIYGNFWTTLEERLILLVVSAGALGSYIHTATSYADFRGNRQFEPSWLLWYLVRPFIGVCLALIVYFAIRGGLLSVVLNSNTPTDATQINPYGIAALAGLTGMFSKQAADKLAEVFSTLFKSAGDASRKDSLTKAPMPEIKSIDPTQGSAEGGQPVTINGTGFATDAKISFGTNAATDVTLVSDQVLTATTPKGEGVVDVIVTNVDGQKATATKAYTYLPGGNGGGGDTVETRDVHDVELKADTGDEHLPITEGGVE